MIPVEERTGRTARQETEKGIGAVTHNSSAATVEK
jgi:hypothetical protein